MEWIEVSKKLPPLSYVESDNEDDYYKPIYVLAKHALSDVCAVVILVQNQDEESFGFGDYTWEVYIPAFDAYLHDDIPFKTYSHWMPLPRLPGS